MIEKVIIPYKPFYRKNIKSLKLYYINHAGVVKARAASSCSIEGLSGRNMVKKPLPEEKQVLFEKALFTVAGNC